MGADSPTRSRRRKCVAQPGHEKCDYCELNGGECVHELPRGGWYEKRAKRARKESQSQSQADDGETSSTGATESLRAHDEPVRLPDTRMLLEITNLYFDYIHDVFHSLFHKATFLQDLMDGKVPPAILFAIVGLALRFSECDIIAEIEPRERGKAYMEEAERLFDMKTISMETVQLAMLLAAGSLADGHMDAENVYHTVACRIAQLVGLPRRLGESPLERETNIRSKHRSIPFIRSARLKQYLQYGGLCAASTSGSAPRLRCPVSSQTTGTERPIPWTTFPSRPSSASASTLSSPSSRRCPSSSDDHRSPSR